MTTLKQSVKKYTFESKEGIHDLVDGINDFLSHQKVDEVINIEYFQEQYGEQTNSKVFKTKYDEEKKESTSIFLWKYMAIITILKEEDVERRLS